MERLLFFASLLSVTEQVLYLRISLSQFSKVIKHEQIQNINLISGLLDYIEYKYIQPEIHELVTQILANFCRDEKIYSTLADTIDLEKLGIMPKDQSGSADILFYNANILSYFHPLPFYEGSSGSILQPYVDPNAGGNQGYPKRPPRSVNTTTPTDMQKSGLKEPKGARTPEVRPRQDSAGRRYTPKDRAALPGNHAVNRTVDTSTLPSTTSANKPMAKKGSTRDDSYDASKTRGDSSKGKKKDPNANVQLPVLNKGSGRPLFTNQ